VVNVVPKIINNLRGKISRAAYQLFSKKGYSAVSMKIVAEETGIAVGTLYNYYANKEELFIKVIEEKINNNKKIFDKYLKKDELDLEKFITHLYDEINKSKGIIDEVIKKDINNKEEKIVTRLRSELLEIVDQILIQIKGKKGIKRGAEAERKRGVYALLIMILILDRRFPEEREKNISYLLKIANLI
jgi:AcrR family transcriptional regulator